MLHISLASCNVRFLTEPTSVKLHSNRNLFCSLSQWYSSLRADFDPPARLREIA